MICGRLRLRGAVLDKSKVMFLTKVLILLSAFTTSELVFAHEGHSHTDEISKENLTTDLATPTKRLFDRVETRLGSYQVVIIHVPSKPSSTEKSGGAGYLVFFLEDFATAAPRTGAPLEVSINFVPYTPEEQAPGIYILDDVFLPPGTHELELRLIEEHFNSESAVSMDIEDGVSVAPTNTERSVNSGTSFWIFVLVGGIFLVIGYLFAQIKIGRAAQTASRPEA